MLGKSIAAELISSSSIALSIEDSLNNISSSEQDELWKTGFSFSGLLVSLKTDVN